MNTTFRAMTAKLLLAASFMATPATPVFAQSSPAIHADHVRFVFPEAPETSNAPFPPNVDQKAVTSQLKSVIIAWRGRKMTLRQYLHAINMDPEKVVTIRVAGDRAAVYTYH
jgi:hypothetical protein